MTTMTYLLLLLHLSECLTFLDLENRIPNLHINQQSKQGIPLFGDTPNTGGPLAGTIFP